MPIVFWNSKASGYAWLKKKFDVQHFSELNPHDRNDQKKLKNIQEALFKLSFTQGKHAANLFRDTNNGVGRHRTSDMDQGQRTIPVLRKQDTASVKGKKRNHKQLPNDE
jgi:hypothetical protein